MHRLMRICALIILTILFFLQYLCGQYKGDIVFAVGFGLPKGGVLSLRYYPADKIALEIHGGMVPHIANYGFGVLVHSSEERPSTTIAFDLTRIMGWNSRFDKDSLSGDTTVVTSVAAWGLNLGIGREFKENEDLLYLVLGPTYLLKRIEYVYNPKSGPASRQTPVNSWLGFLEAGTIHTRSK